MSSPWPPTTPRWATGESRAPLAFALLLGAIVAGMLFRYFRASWWSLAVLFFLVIASHGLLDALTRGGEGVLFFWPMGGATGNRGPIPVSDIALELPDPRHSRAVRSELLWVWLPTSLVVGLVMAWRYYRRRSPCCGHPGLQK